MAVVFEFVRPHGWFTFAFMLLVNGVLCYRYGGRVLFVTIPFDGVVNGFLDAAWIRSEMAKTDWDRQPDQDGIFVLGTLLRGVVAGMLLFMSFLFVVALSNAMNEGRRYNKR